MNSEELKPGYEYVFTVTEYFDGPRKGIANYQGNPHFYECIFDEVKDDYSGVFQLTPLDSETLKLAMEDWEIWRRWNLPTTMERQTLTRIRRCRTKPVDTQN
jgi:hypothetical protein